VATKSKSIKKPAYDCDDVEAYLDKAISRVREEILPKIQIIDNRDKEQYEAAKKIITDANTVVLAKTELAVSAAQSAKDELDAIVAKQDAIVGGLNGSLESLHDKLDAHITEETDEFRLIRAALTDISENGTVLARQINDSLNHIKVNGGTYPLGEAIRYIYDAHVKTHSKIDEVASLVEPIRARAIWFQSTRDLIKKNGILHFFFNSRFGAIVGLLLLLLLINTIAVDVFHVNLDLVSILKWFFGLFAKSS